MSLNLRHACTTCGGSCSGVRVRVLEEQRVAQIEQFAATMGIDQPFVNGVLRQTEEGRCVFLDETHLCRIHAQYGADAKPLICRQYPIVGVRTETGERRGIDPGCYSAFQTQNAAPVSLGEAFAWAHSEFPEPLARMEQALLSVVMSPDQTIDGALARLAGEAQHHLPKGLLERLWQRLNDPKFTAAATHQSAGPAVRTGLAPIVSAVHEGHQWHVSDPVSHRVNTWMLEATRRVIWLRLCPNMPSPMIACLMSLLGAVTVSRLVRQEDAQVAAFTAWSRAMRSSMFWGHFFPDVAAVHWLLRG